MPAHTLVCFLYAKPDNIDKVKEKLQEASQVYSKDKDTLAWWAQLRALQINEY